ncbi:MAG TPA: Xaa-Pro dipeptidase [Candidatus Krumholzibacteria bacterium]|nr:Xaa-Pro dipeptidase [Candidatus Krumholzibacteria bacterium]
MNLKELFADHIQRVSAHTDKALTVAAEAEAAYDGIVFHAGTQDNYHADDQGIPFRPVPHFARFAPVAGPEHLLVYRPGMRPRLYHVVPEDYWYEPPAAPQHPYAEVLEVVRVGSRDEASKAMGDVSRYAYVGNHPRAAAALRIPLAQIEPKTLLAALDWFRGYKTPYEVHCIRAAARRAASGHRRAREGFAAQHSERHLHTSYLDATTSLEFESPYTNIIAWDANASVLHYQTKSTSAPNPGAVMLIDAGSAEHGYASDITRTYANDRAHPMFRTMLDRMEDLQRQLVQSVRPGGSYVDLQADTHRGVATILCEAGLLRTSVDDAVERGLTRPFFPHGVGHHLGLQVHDVGGRQVDVKGARREPPAGDPYLRTTRDLEVGHVLTVEPGLYFIPMLLEPYRGSRDSSAFDWNLVDQLVPCGGIRIEDDILVTTHGNEDLTREHVPGHRTA